MLKQGGQPTASLKIVPLSEVYFPFVTSSDTPKADLAQKDELGGLLRLRPSGRQVVLANRAINVNGGGGNGFLPTALDARSGQVAAPLPATRGRVPSLQPHAPSLRPYAPSLRPYAPSLRPYAPSLQPHGNPTHPACDPTHLACSPMRPACSPKPYHHYRCRSSTRSA